MKGVRHFLVGRRTAYDRGHDDTNQAWIGSLVWSLFRFSAILTFRCKLQVQYSYIYIRVGGRGGGFFWAFFCWPSNSIL